MLQRNSQGYYEGKNFPRLHIKNRFPKVANYFNSTKKSKKRLPYSSDSMTLQYLKNKDFLWPF